MSVRYIPIVEAELSDPFGIQMCRNAGIEIRFKDPNEPRVIVLTTLDWLRGSNQWGYHNNQVFSAPPSKTKQSIRIMDTAEQAELEERTHVPLAEGDWEEIKKLVDQSPQPHPAAFPIPTSVARVILPITEAITGAKKEVPEGWEKKDEGEEKPGKAAVEA